METKGVFSIRNHQKCPSQLFLIHLNTYVMGLRSLLKIFTFTAQGQILTTKVDSRAVRVKTGLIHLTKNDIF